MSRKEMETYIGLLEKRVERIEESLNRYRRGIAEDAKNGYSLGTISCQAQNAREEEVEMIVLKDVIMNLKCFLRNNE